MSSIESGSDLPLDLQPDLPDLSTVTFRDPVGGFHAISPEEVAAMEEAVEAVEAAAGFIPEGGPLPFDDRSRNLGRGALRFADRIFDFGDLPLISGNALNHMRQQGAEVSHKRDDHRRGNLGQVRFSIGHTRYL